MRPDIHRAIVATGAGLVALAFPLVARALTQPNGATIPSAMGCANNEPTGLLAAMACACTQPGVCNIGAACPGGAPSCDDGQHGTCESTIWHSPNDNSCIPSNVSGLNPATQAATTPETFHPTCALSFDVVSRGTAKFENSFGWYNATTGAPPAASDLHTMINCGDAAGKTVSLDLSSEPAYKGGDIGFFLVTPEDPTAHGTCAGGDCCATVTRFQAGQGFAYYSQKEFNPDDTAAAPYIHLLILQSEIATHKFYFAWEDTFDTSSADFTDLITSVGGVDCSGAGEPCNTGKLGICAQGITTCSSGGTLGCQQLQQPQPEVCNGLDDNCDGIIGDGATCPTAGDICVNGSCVPPCTSSEFPCSNGETCDSATRLCIDKACIGVTCPSTQICYAGACVTPCQGVTCPTGQTCVGDACLDLCNGVACSAGETCREGSCFPGCATCGGLSCDAPLTCDAASGACIDPSCPNGCGVGTVCQSGACVDACTGVTCPHGQTCSGGNCVTDGPDAGAGLVGTSGPNGVNGSGADGGANGEQPDYPNVTSHACSCRMQPSRSAEEIAGAFFAALAIGGAVARRRRRIV